MILTPMAKAVTTVYGRHRMNIHAAWWWEHRAGPDCPPVLVIDPQPARYGRRRWGVEVLMGSARQALAAESP